MRRLAIAVLSPLFVLLASLAVAPSAFAQDDGLLPVEQAFALRASAPDRTQVRLDWTIADGYYLYRDRTKLKTDTAGVTLGAATFSEGETKTDEFFGEVVVFHHTASATVPLQVTDDVASVALSVTVQGCHEEEPKICYPPHRQIVEIALPPAVAASPSASSPLAASDPFASNVDRTNVLTTGGGALPGAPSNGFGGPVASPGATDALPLPEDQAFRFEAITTPEDGILARFVMPPGYYLYRDKTTFSANSTPAVALAAPRWPAGVSHEDEHFGTVTVFFGTVEVPVPLSSAASPELPRPLALTATFQGCQEDGICYPPMTRTVSLQLPAPSTLRLRGAEATPIEIERAETERSETDQFGDLLAGGSRLWALLVFFGVGVGLAFTPCVLPMVPILSGIIAGAGENVSTGRAAFLSLIYVLASAVVFTAAGVFAGLAGENLQAILQKPWVLIAFAGLFVALAISMFGYYELQMPTWLQNRVNAWSNQQKPGSVAGVAVMGVLSALLVGPCVAPPLAGAVLYISQQRDALFGGAALFALSLGMGVPLIVFGASAGTLMPRAGAWMNAVKNVFGVIFLGLALWMLERVLDPVWIMLGWGALLIGSGVHLGALERLPEAANGMQRTAKALGVLLLALGIIQLLGVAAGGRDYLRPLAEWRSSGGAATEEKASFRMITSAAELDRALADASAQRRAVLFDFYADWCVECKRMEKYTFTDPDVLASLDDFVTLKIDVTAQNDDDKALQKNFSIVGPPATLFFACEAGERESLRLVGFEHATPFAERLARARGC